MKELYIILENFSSTKLEKNGKYGKIFLSQKAEKGGEVSGWWEKDRKMPHPVVGCGRELRQVVGVGHITDDAPVLQDGLAGHECVRYRANKLGCRTVLCPSFLLKIDVMVTDSL